MTEETERKNDPRIVRICRGDVARATGHRYRALELALDDLDTEALMDLRRLIDNLKTDAQREKRKRRRGQFWG